jgi:hypothetical protein
LKLILALTTQALMLEERTSVLEAKVESIAGSSGYYTVKGWAKIHGVQMPHAEAALLGRECSSMCRQRDLIIGQARDEAFGFVNTYPEAIITEVWNSRQ